jgi:hypothetical protein
MCNHLIDAEGIAYSGSYIRKIGRRKYGKKQEYKAAKNMKDNGV